MAPPRPGQGAAASAVLLYGACSSLLLVVNKVAVHVLPAPSIVLLAQFVTSALAAWACGACGLLTVDRLEWRKLLAFLPISVTYLLPIVANIKTLQHANVETFIVFRASTPLLICVCDYWLLGRQLPSRRSTASLLVLALATVGFVLTDHAFEVRGYAWVGAWYAAFCFNQLYIKLKLDTVAVESNWGRVLYTNLWAAATTALAIAAFDPHVGASLEWSAAGGAVLGASCVVGVAMAYAAFLCRAAVSATSFTVIGNVCKIATVLINISVWDKHASPVGIGFLLLGLSAAYGYEEAPLRPAAAERGHLKAKTS